jgi:hypothetical protein
VILTALLSKQVQFAPWSDADQVAQIRAYALEHLADPNLAWGGGSPGRAGAGRALRAAAAVLRVVAGQRRVKNGRTSPGRWS